MNKSVRKKLPMPYWRKLVEPLLQIALLPISVFVQVFCVLAAMIYCYAGWYNFSYHFFFKLLKKDYEKIKEVYKVGASEITVNKTVYKDIKDSDGNVIGSYETTELQKEFDSGNRYILEDDTLEGITMLYEFIALPCRIVALIASILAVFIPRLYVSAIRVDTQEKYYKKLYRYLDILIFEKPKNNQM